MNLTNKKTMRTVKDYTIIPIEACKYFNPRQLYLLAGLYINAHYESGMSYMTTNTTYSQLSMLTGVSIDYIKTSFVPRLKELKDIGYNVETTQEDYMTKRNTYYLPNPKKNYRIIWAELFRDSSLSPEEKGVMIGLYCLCVNKEFRIDLTDKEIYTILDMSRILMPNIGTCSLRRKSYGLPMMSPCNWHGMSTWIPRSFYTLTWGIRLG